MYVFMYVSICPSLLSSLSHAMTEINDRDTIGVMMLASMDEVSDGGGSDNGGRCWRRLGFHLCLDLSYHLGLRHPVIVLDCLPYHTFFMRMEASQEHEGRYSNLREVGYSRDQSVESRLGVKRPFLGNAVRAFKSLRIRIGGSLQDQVLYNVGNLQTPCHQFTKTRDGLFGFSSGCLPMDRWDEVYNLFSDSGVLVTFGLNALHGRHHMRQDLWGGDWDPSNAKDFINYTISKSQKIDSWEFGNELSGSGVGARVEADQYGKDLIKLKKIINNLYENLNPKPILVAPGGFYDKRWFDQLLEVSGSLVVNAVSHHIYNLGPGDDINLVSKILDPDYLSKVSDTFSSLNQTIKTHGNWSFAWVGESGGAYNSGGRNVSNAFVSGFWYLDQLGMAAMYDTKVYCRQTLIGGNYGLLDTTTYVPNPDYYSALLWHRLMGKDVLALSTSASPHLRTYAHCSKGREAITLLLINLSNQTQYDISIENNINVISIKTKESSLLHDLKRTVSPLGIKSSDKTLYRHEYHLTPENGYIKSRTMLLNGQPLRLTNGGNIPVLEPLLVDLNSRLFVPPLSTKFVVFPNFDAPVCR